MGREVIPNVDMTVSVKMVWRAAGEVQLAARAEVKEGVMPLAAATAAGHVMVV